MANLWFPDFKTSQLVVLRLQTGQLMVLRIQMANLWELAVRFWPIRTHGSDHSNSLKFNHQFLTNQNTGFSSDQSGCMVQTSSSDQSQVIVQFTTSKNASSEITTSKNASYFTIKRGLLTPFHSHPRRQILTGTTTSLIPHLNPQISSFPLYLFELLSNSWSRSDKRLLRLVISIIY